MTATTEANLRPGQRVVHHVLGQGVVRHRLRAGRVLVEFDTRPKGRSMYSPDFTETVHSTHLTPVPGEGDDNVPG